MALKFRELEGLAQQHEEQWVPDGTPNLYVFCRSSGRMSWVCRITIGGKRTNLTLGTWPDLKADVARQVTSVIKGLVGAGYSAQVIKSALGVTVDPIALQRLVITGRVSDHDAPPTFEEVARDWYDNHLKAGLSEGAYKRQVIQQLEDYVFPALGTRPVNQIKRREIVETLKDIWLAKPPSGKKLRGNVERIFDYAVDQEFLEFNPCPPVRSMPKQNYVEKHFDALTPEQAPAMWRWLNNHDGLRDQTRYGLMLVLLTGKRSSEVRHMEWGHIDLNRGIWTTPAEGMKMRKEHRQPLSRQVLALLGELHHVSGGRRYVLGNAKDRVMSENAMLYAIKEFSDVTVHGLRATLGSWMAENGVRKIVADFVKAHQPKSFDVAYQRSDLLEERRDVLQRWADYVSAD